MRGSAKAQNYGDKKVISIGIFFTLRSVVNES